MNLTNEQHAKLIHMQTFMKRSELYAQYWIAMATTRATCRRIVSKCDKRLTPEELIDNALNTSLTHIFNMDKTANNIFLLLTGREDEISE